MKGATGNIYTGLHEYEEMGFLLHLLRPEDLFGDIGANIGAYTILASAVSKSHTVSIEPIYKSFKNLKRNVAINEIDTLVKIIHGGVSSANGELTFASQYDTGNHVVANQENLSEGFEKVLVFTLDEIFRDKTPLLLKIDVEGFEMAVLRGGTKLLSNNELKGIIIELSSLCYRYGAKNEDVHQLLLSFGFKVARYDPMTRKLGLTPEYNKVGNSIYVRDIEWIEKRTMSSRKIKVLNSQI
jgi:FkbM family methyltransferase